MLQFFNHWITSSILIIIFCTMHTKDVIQEKYQDFINKLHQVLITHVIYYLGRGIQTSIKCGKKRIRERSAKRSTPQSGCPTLSGSSPLRWVCWPPCTQTQVITLTSIFNCKGNRTRKTRKGALKFYTFMLKSSYLPSINRVIKSTLASITTQPISHVVHAIWFPWPIWVAERISHRTTILIISCLNFQPLNGLCNVLIWNNQN